MRRMFIILTLLLSLTTQSGWTQNLKASVDSVKNDSIVYKFAPKDLKNLRKYVTYLEYRDTLCTNYQKIASVADSSKIALYKIVSNDTIIISDKNKIITVQDNKYKSYVKTERKRKTAIAVICTVVGFVIKCIL